jgi:hypothetical protein
MSGFSGADAPSEYPPTARHAVAVGQDTLMKLLRTVPAGFAGRSTVQRLPFHCSMSIVVGEST